LVTGRQTNRQTRQTEINIGSRKQTDKKDRVTERKWDTDRQTKQAGIFKCRSFKHYILQVY
jgi:hypothetical protein